jgi:hypothetical protein
MKRSMRIATTTMVTMAVASAGFMSPVAGSTTGVASQPDTFDAADFFPMAVGNAWRWVDANDASTCETMTIVDQTEMAGHAVWVAETRKPDGFTDTIYFVDHKTGLYATRFLDTLMDWAHDPAETGGLQRWTVREAAFGTHAFRSGGAATAYTVAVTDGVPMMRVHNAESGTTYQQYAMGIGPVVRGQHLVLQSATVNGVEHVL